MPRVSPDVDFDPIYFHDSCETVVFGYRSNDVREMVGDTHSVAYSYTSRAGDGHENRGSWDRRLT